MSTWQIGVKLVLDPQWQAVGAFVDSHLSAIPGETAGDGSLRAGYWHAKGKDGMLGLIHDRLRSAVADYIAQLNSSLAVQETTVAARTESVTGDGAHTPGAESHSSDDRGKNSDEEETGSAADDASATNEDDGMGETTSREGAPLHAPPARLRGHATSLDASVTSAVPSAALKGHAAVDAPVTAPWRIPQRRQLRQSNLDAEAAALRKAALSSPQLVRPVRALWNSLGPHKDDRGHMTQRTHSAIFATFFAAVAFSQPPQERATAVAADWVLRCNGRPTVDGDQFEDSVLQMCDAWCETSDAAEFAEFVAAFGVLTRRALSNVSGAGGSGLHRSAVTSLGATTRSECDGGGHHGEEADLQGGHTFGSFAGASFTGVGLSSFAGAFGLGGISRGDQRRLSTASSVTTLSPYFGGAPAPPPLLSGGVGGGGGTGTTAGSLAPNAAGGVGGGGAGGISAASTALAAVVLADAEREVEPSKQAARGIVRGSLGRRNIDTDDITDGHAAFATRSLAGFAAALNKGFVPAFDTRQSRYGRADISGGGDQQTKEVKTKHREGDVGPEAKGERRSLGQQLARPELGFQAQTPPAAAAAALPPNAQLPALAPLLSRRGEATATSMDIGATVAETSAASAAHARPPVFPRRGRGGVTDGTEAFATFLPTPRLARVMASPTSAAAAAPPLARRLSSQRRASTTGSEPTGSTWATIERGAPLVALFPSADEAISQISVSHAAAGLGTGSLLDAGSTGLKGDCTGGTSTGSLKQLGRSLCGAPQWTVHRFEFSAAAVGLDGRPTEVPVDVAAVPPTPAEAEAKAARFFDEAAPPYAPLRAIAVPRDAAALLRRTVDALPPTPRRRRAVFLQAQRSGGAIAAAAAAPEATSGTESVAASLTSPTRAAAPAHNNRNTEDRTGPATLGPRMLGAQRCHRLAALRRQRFPALPFQWFVNCGTSGGDVVIPPARSFPTTPPVPALPSLIAGISAGAQNAVSATSVVAALVDVVGTGSSDTSLVGDGAEGCDSVRPFPTEPPLGDYWLPLSQEESSVLTAAWYAAASRGTLTSQRRTISVDLARMTCTQVRASSQTRSTGRPRRPGSQSHHRQQQQQQSETTAAEIAVADGGNAADGGGSGKASLVGHLSAGSFAAQPAALQTTDERAASEVEELLACFPKGAALSARFDWFFEHADVNGVHWQPFSGVHQRALTAWLDGVRRTVASTDDWEQQQRQARLKATNDAAYRRQFQATLQGQLQNARGTTHIFDLLNGTLTSWCGSRCTVAGFRFRTVFIDQGHTEAPRLVRDDAWFPCPATEFCPAAHRLVFASRDGPSSRDAVVMDIDVDDGRDGDTGGAGGGGDSTGKGSGRALPLVRRALRRLPTAVLERFGVRVGRGSEVMLIVPPPPPPSPIGGPRGSDGDIDGDRGIAGALAALAALDAATAVAEAAEAAAAGASLHVEASVWGGDSDGMRKAHSHRREDIAWEGAVVGGDCPKEGRIARATFTGGSDALYDSCGRSDTFSPLVVAGDTAVAGTMLTESPSGNTARYTARVPFELPIPQLRRAQIGRLYKRFDSAKRGGVETTANNKVSAAAGRKSGLPFVIPNASEGTLVLASAERRPVSRQRPVSPLQTLAPEATLPGIVSIADASQGETGQPIPAGMTGAATALRVSPALSSSRFQRFGAGASSRPPPAASTRAFTVASPSPMVYQPSSPARDVDLGVGIGGGAAFPGSRPTSPPNADPTTAAVVESDTDVRVVDSSKPTTTAAQSPLATSHARVQTPSPYCVRELSRQRTKTTGGTGVAAPRPSARGAAPAGAALTNSTERPRQPSGGRSLSLAAAAELFGVETRPNSRAEPVRPATSMSLTSSPMGGSTMACNGGAVGSPQTSAARVRGASPTVSSLLGGHNASGPLRAASSSSAAATLLHASQTAVPVKRLTTANTHLSRLVGSAVGAPVANLRLMRQPLGADSFLFALP